MAKHGRGGRAALRIVRQYFPSVSEVHDGDEDVVLEVVSEDSTSGMVKDHTHCAFARACQKKFKARGVIVSVKTVYVIQKEGATRYRLPESVSREIVSFDRKAGFADGEYTLKAPNKSERLGARSERDNSNATHEKSKGGKKRLFHFTAGIRAMLRGGRVAPMRKGVAGVGAS